MELTQDQINRIHSMAAQCLGIMEKQDRKGQYNVLVKLYTDQFKESNKSRDYYGELQTWKNLTGTYEKHVKQCELKMAEMQKSMNASAAELQNEKAKTYRWYQAYTDQKAALEKDNAQQDKLKEETEKLKQEKFKIQEQLDTLKQGANDETLQKMLAEQQELTRNNQELQEKNAGLRSEVAALKSEMETVRTQNASSEAQEKLAVEIDDLNAENHQLKMQLEELQQKQPEQNKVNKALHEKNEKLLKEVDNLRGENQILKEQMEHIQESQSARKVRSDDDDDIDEELEELIEEKEGLEDQVDELKNVNKQLKEQLTQMKEKSKESVMLQKKCNELIAKNKWLQKQNDDLEKASKETKKSDTPTIQEQFEKMGINYDEMQQQMDALRIEKEQLIQQKMMQEERFKLDMEALQQEISRLKIQLGTDTVDISADSSIPSVPADTGLVPDVPDAPELRPAEAFRLSTSIEEVDKNPDAKFLSVLLMGTNVELREMPAQGAPIVVIGNFAYPNPRFYKGFLNGQETLSSVRPLRSLFEVEGLQDDWQVRYKLESIEPAGVQDVDGEIQLTEKGRIVLQTAV